MALDKTFDELAEEAISGDMEAENRLFTLLHASFLRLAKRRIGNEDDAKDIVQQALMTALEKCKGAELVKGFLPWANQILYFKIGNYRKAIKSRRTTGLNDQNWRLRDRVATQPDVMVAGRELDEILKKAISKMGGNCKRVLSSLLLGHTREELQQQFGGIPMGTIDSLIHRCRKRLKEILKKDFGYEV